MKKYSRSVNYYETDQMGIVHHSNYIRYFEEARLQWMDEIGLSYRGLEERGMIIPVTFVDCQYKQPVRFGDTICISVRMAKFDGLKMEFAYEVRDEITGELRSTGRTGHCFLDRDMHPVLIRKNAPELYDIMLNALREDGGAGRKGMDGSIFVEDEFREPAAGKEKGCPSAGGDGHGYEG